VGRPANGVRGRVLQRLLTITVAAGGLLASAEAAARGPAPEPTSDPRVVRSATPKAAARNDFTIATTFVRDFAGTDLLYRRHLGWRVSGGVAVEYLYAHPGFEYLQGAAERVELAIWPSRVFAGPFLAAHVAASQQFLARDATVRSVALGGGADVGWNWMLGFGLNVGVAAGVRRSTVVSSTDLICTRVGECPFAREDFMPRFALQLSWAF
jgi:hypothetical protein